jgi:hypothetical protein
LFDGILDKPVEPLVIKGLFGPYYRFYEQLKLIVTGFAKLPVGNMEIVPPGFRMRDGVFTYITDKGFHNKLLVLTVRSIKIATTSLYSTVEKKSR